MTQSERQTEIERRAKITIGEFLEYRTEAAINYLNFIETPDYLESGLRLTFSQFQETGENLVNEYLDFKLLRNEQTE